MTLAQGVDAMNKFQSRVTTFCWNSEYHLNTGQVLGSINGAYNINQSFKVTTELFCFHSSTYLSSHENGRVGSRYIMWRLVSNDLDFKTIPNFHILSTRSINISTPKNFVNFFPKKLDEKERKRERDVWREIQTNKICLVAGAMPQEFKPKLSF